MSTIASRVKQLRRTRGWTAAEVGERMTRLGVSWDRFTVANLEKGKRSTVTVTELLALSVVFDVAPVHMLVSPEAGDYSITPSFSQPAARVRAWVRGEQPLPGTHLRTWHTEVPLHELRAEELR